MIWKVVVKSFHLVESNLAWSVGNGEKLKIGKDPWMGSTQQHLLPDHIINSLGQRGIVTLNQLENPRPDEPWTQYWRRANTLILDQYEEGVLDLYIRELVLAHIHLIDQEDELVWDLDPAGSYTPKAGYIKLSTEVDPREEVWWWRPLWKLKCPAKTKLFMWCVLENRVPTWDMLQKINFQGPGWCVLCKREHESITHLFLSCSYSVEV